MATSEVKAQNALAELGLPTNDSMVAQMVIVAEALALFDERSSLRGNLWREFPPTDKVTHLTSKLARIRMGEEVLASGVSVKPDAIQSLADEALDMINYAAFYVRQRRDGEGVPR